MIARRLSAWPPLPPLAHLRRPPVTAAPYPLEDPSYRLFARARHAIYHGVRALGLGSDDEVLMPAFHHGSEVEALSRAGIRLRWYEGDELYRPDAGELEKLVGKRTRALYLIHYFGFPQDSARWRAWCDERQLLLVEDAAQAWLAHREGQPLGSLADLAVFCLYKTLPLSEGAALVSARPPSAPTRAEPYGLQPLIRGHGAWLAQRSGAANSALRPFKRSSLYSPDRDRELGDPDVACWRSVEQLLPRLADPHVAAVRRAHCAILLDALGDSVQAPFDAVPSGASPFVLPSTAGDKLRVLEDLERAGVNALNLWSVPHPALPVDEFPLAARRRASLVGLPVHQELAVADLDRIASAAGSRRARPAERPLEPLGTLAELREEWSKLAEEAGNIFSTWEFVSTWWRHFGGRADLRLLGRRDGDGRLAAIAPLYRSTLRGVRTLRLLGHGVADQLDLICAEAERAPMARSLRRHLREASDWDVCLLERLPAETGWDAMLETRVIRRQPSPVLHVRGRSWEQVLGSLSSNHRQQVRRRESKLIRERGLRYRLASDPERLDEDLDRLFALHDARWGSRSSGFSTRWQLFHREFARIALERGWLRLWFAEVSGDIAAAWYGFRFGNSEWYYQAGRDRRFGEHSIGGVLLAHSIRSSVEDGVDSYRFLLGDEPYKIRFSVADSPVDTQALARRGRGALVVDAARAAAKTPLGRRAIAQAAARTMPESGQRGRVWGG